MGPLYNLRTHKVGVKRGLGSLCMLVGFAVRGWPLIWPIDSLCKCLVSFGGLWVLEGSAARVWSIVWPMDLQCRCLVLFRGYVGPCGLHGGVVVPHLVQGPMVQVSGAVWDFFWQLWASWFGVLVPHIAQGPMM